MILKLTDTMGDVLLFDTTGSSMHVYTNGVHVYRENSDNYHVVKETIEEIEQQIKNGGVCGNK
jgi:hypothetical protein